MTTKEEYLRQWQQFLESDEAFERLYEDVCRNDNELDERKEDD